MQRITHSSTLVVLVAALVVGIPAAAHQGPHVEARRKISTTPYPWGVQGDPRKATRTIVIDMADTMRFSPDAIAIEPGATVKFVLKNGGTQLHEMVIGTEAALREHAQAMKSQPDMAHDAPYMAHVQPGAAGVLTWTFIEPGTYMFGCLIPGHWEAGMKGTIVVAKKAAQ
jgi:uncharacterized cupredoxin-like copper-binding protein